MIEGWKMPLFQKDLSGPDRLRNTLQNVANRALQFQAQRAELQRQREEDSYINNVISRTRERLSPRQEDVSLLPQPTTDPSKYSPYRRVQPGETLPEGVTPIRRSFTTEPTDLEKTQAYDEAELSLLRRRPSERMNQAVATIGRMRPRVDTTMTDTELAVKAADEQQQGAPGKFSAAYEMRKKEQQPHQDQRIGEAIVKGRKIATMKRPSGETYTVDLGEGILGGAGSQDRKLGEAPVNGRKIGTFQRPTGERYTVDLGEATGGSGAGKIITETVNRAKPGAKAASPFTYRGTAQQVITKMEEDLKRIETMPLGKKKESFIGIDALAADVQYQQEFDKFKAGDIGIAELPEPLQNLATEYSELKGKIENLQQLYPAEGPKQKATGTATAHVQAPVEAIEHLKKNPSLKDAIKQKNGYLRPRS